MRSVPRTLLILSWFALLASLFGRYHWLCDLVSHFVVQFVVGVSVVGVWLFLLRQWRWGLAACMTIASLISMILPLYIRPPMDANVGLENSSDSMHKLRMVSSNVLTSNPNKAATIDFLRESKADVILLLEVDKAWQDATEVLHALYPFQAGEASQDNFGILLLSRHPMTNVSMERFDDSRVASIVATLDLNGDSLRIIGIHPMPPMSYSMARMRNQHFESLARIVNQHVVSTIVMGDFNCTGWSYYFQKLLQESRLQDSRRGFGVQASWPAGAGFPCFRIPIDHLLTTPNITTTDRRLGPDINSDHLPVVADLLWRGAR